jgi:hypothetical protein
LLVQGFTEVDAYEKAGYKRTDGNASTSRTAPTGSGSTEMHRDHAIIETLGSARQTYRRRAVEVGRVMLAWELMGCQK